MPNVGTISGGMYLDPSGYITGLNQAAQSTQMFQAGVERLSFAGFHRGIFATTTLLYGLNRIMSSMSQGMEEYTNMLGRIGSVADMTAASVEALADSMKKLSVAQGVSRTDIMGGMYTAAQSGFSSPAEMRAMATSGALLSRASGKEIDVKKAVDLMSVARQALGIGQGAVSSNRMTNLLLRGRDVGRWELDEMAQALGIPLTVYGNQFAGKIGGEETLRQLMAIMSTATLAGVNPRMTATGTRRLVERSIQLQHSKRGDELRSALRGIGFKSGDPIGEAMSSPMDYLNTILRLTGGNTSELGRLGFGSRDLMVVTSALRQNGGTLNDLYQQLSYANTSGTTEKYNEKMLQTYDAKRDQLRAQWMITSQEFMQASIPVIEQFTNALMSFNQIAQNLPASVKSFMMLVSGLAAMRLALNFLGFRSQRIDFKPGLNATKSPSVAAAVPTSRIFSAPKAPSYIPSPSLVDERPPRQQPYSLIPSQLGKGFARGELGNVGQNYPYAMPQTEPSFANKVGMYVGARNTFESKGIAAKAAMYSSMGIGGGAQAIGWAVSGISRFGSAIWSVVGPMAQFGAIIMTLMKLFEGWSYTGSTSASIGGKTQLESGGKLPAFLTSIGHGYKMMGSFLHHGTKYLSDMTDDYAREQGYVPGIEGVEDNGSMSKSQMIKAIAKTAFDSTFLGGVIGTFRGRPMGLAGYRPGTTKDAGADLRRELLTPGEVRQFSKKGGINFDDFSTIKPYLNRYVTEQIGQTPPDDWDAWIAKTEGGYGKVQQWGANALRFYRGDILGNIQRTFDKDNRIWRASAPDDIKQGLVEARALRDSQWDLYKSADYSTPNGNGSLNWNAGGRDYRKLYNDELARMDASYGNFAQQSPYDMAKGRIDGLNAMWNKRASANGMKFAGLGIDEETEFALKDAKGESERQKMMRSFLKVMPDIGTMDIDSAKGWFTKLTGRDADISKANFDNFRHMDLRNFISPETIGKDVKYAAATQFGTAEAYNQLLPQQNAQEKIVVAMDKFEKYIETLKVDREESDTAMSEIMKKAAAFLKDAENTQFFTNIQDIAANTGE